MELLPQLTLSAKPEKTTLTECSNRPLVNKMMCSYFNPVELYLI